jgi:choline dehydrogenase-like flavoprotein
MSGSARDILIIGSGPSGAMAAATLVQAGAIVEMLDVGLQDSTYDAIFPELPFKELRRTDPNQARYLLGDRLEGVPVGDQILGALLTPPRQFLLEAPGSSRFPIRSQPHIEVRQSLAYGGLGVGWAATCFTYSDAELTRMGLDPSGFARFYTEVATEIGVSGSTEDDCYASSFGQTRNLQPPIEIDSNARTTLESYAKKRESLNRSGFYLGRSYLALLTRALGDRDANPYYDMDMYHDLGRSVYRPRYTVEALKGRQNFSYSPGLKVLRFDELADGTVEVTCERLSDQGIEKRRAARLIICAGAINSARIALHSLGIYGRETRFLNSPGTFLPSLNLKMLGRRPEEKRISLAQLSGLFVPEDAADDPVSFQINHYSSLMLFKLVKEMPLPPWAGLIVSRLLVSSLSVVGVYHSDAPDRDSALSLTRPNVADDGAVQVRYVPSPAKEHARLEREARLKRGLRKLCYLPLFKVNPKWGTSMHYAGTIPMATDATLAHGPISTEPSYRLRGTKSVYIGDSSSWNHLPAKGPTFTIMANARKVAEEVYRSLRG